MDNDAALLAFLFVGVVLAVVYRLFRCLRWFIVGVTGAWLGWKIARHLQRRL